MSHWIPPPKRERYPRKLKKRVKHFEAVRRYVESEWRFIQALSEHHQKVKNDLFELLLRSHEDR